MNPKWFIWAISALEIGAGVAWLGKGSTARALFWIGLAFVNLCSTRF